MIESHYVFIIIISYEFTYPLCKDFLMLFTTSGAHKSLL